MSFGTKLNPSQLRGATTHAPRVVILAGAGTGKTSTAVHWAADLVDHGVARDKIMMISFTRGAGEELSKRFNALRPPAGGGVNARIGTYHSVISRLIREDGPGFGFGDGHASVVDPAETRIYMKLALQDVFGKMLPSGVSPATVQDVISYAHNTMTPLDEMFDSEYAGMYTGQLLRAASLFDSRKRESRLMDYDDILCAMLTRLTTDPAYASAMRSRFEHVLVDEFQDNNKLNFSLLKALNPAHLTVVGDRQQSIYRFRGAEPRLIDIFIRENPGCRVIALEDNYRSGQSILDLANLIVSGSGQSLRLRAARPVHAQLQAQAYANDFDMADTTAREIRLRLLEGEKPADIAVLTRSSRTLFPLEAALRREGISYRKYGGVALTDAAEVRDFTAVLRLLDNPRDQIALSRALCLFPGVGTVTAQRFAGLLPAAESKIKTPKAGKPQSLQGDMFAMLAPVPDTPAAPPELTDRIPDKASQLAKWLGMAARLPGLRDKGKYLLSEMAPLLREVYSADNDNGEQRLASLRDLVDMMGAHESKGGSLADFLEIFVLGKGEEKPHPSDAITLSTIHSAKGLEWDRVFFYGCADTQIPHPRSVESEDDIDEERRLAYVAVTRGKSNVSLLMSQENSPAPSRFLPEVLAWDVMPACGGGVGAGYRR